LIRDIALGHNLRLCPGRHNLDYKLRKSKIDWIQSITVIISILIPTLIGFAWMANSLRSIDRRLNNLETKSAVLETRIGFVERLLEMMGTPIKNFMNQERTDP
jgi:hypothetical protein